MAGTIVTRATSVWFQLMGKKNPRPSMLSDRNRECKGRSVNRETRNGAYRSNLVDRMIEEVVRSTPSRAPIRSMT
jgi:hypothetical protein